MSEPKIGTSRAKKTIDKINKELENYKMSPIIVKNGKRIGGSALADSLEAAIIGVKKGLRFLKGDPPISNLKKRKEKLLKLLDDARELKEIGFIKNGKVTDFKGKLLSEREKNFRNITTKTPTKFFKHKLINQK